MTAPPEEGGAPIITGGPTISGTPAVGNVLTATAAPVTGNPTITRTWQWSRNGVDISGATSATYTLVPADANTSIRVRQIETNGVGTTNATSVAVFIGTLPVPALSGAAVSGITPTAVQASVSTTVADGTLFFVATTSATPPSGAQIAAGQDNTGAAAAFAASQGVYTTGTQDLFNGAFGLTTGQTYYGYFYQTAPGGNSNVSGTGAFVPADVTPAQLTSLDANDTSSTNWTGAINTDTAEGTIDVVITTSSTAPTADQIIAGQNHLGASAVSRVDSQAVTTTGPQTFGGAGLSAGQTYWAHATQTDAAGNKTPPITSASFST